LWRATKRKRYLFRRRNGLHGQLFITHSDHAFKSRFYIVPCGISEALVWRFGCEPDKSDKPELPASVAGEGVVGPLGPRTGSSSGVLPGSSCGCGGAPGSRIGGGTSGRGLPGGSSGGGSVGWPGVAGGISGGSIGIYIATLRWLVMFRSIGSGAITARSRRCSAARRSTREPSRSIPSTANFRGSISPVLSMPPGCACRLDCRAPCMRPSQRRRGTRRCRLR
jgi:hypothetical protein